MPAKKQKKPSKTLSIRKLIKVADKEMSILIRSLGYCQRCNSTEMLQHAHIVPRTNATLRYSIVNGLCLCYRCHILFGHHDPLGFVEWLNQKFPERMVYLQERRNIFTKRTTDDLLEIIKNCKARNLKALS